MLVGTSTASVASTLVLQGNSSAFSTQAILVLARGVNNPSDAQLLGSLNFSDSGHAQCGAVEARRDGGTWTSGTSHPTRLVFSTTADGTSSPTERMRITSDAYVRLASGTGGIQFNGDTAAANALDDYEEGTWTPSLVFLTSGSVTLTDVNGYYTKIGRQVFVHCIIRVSTLSSPTGDAVIEGLPFAANSAGSFPQYISVGNTTNAHDIVGNINPDSVLTANQATTINLFKDVQQATRLTGADIVGGGSATAIRISMSYTT